MRPLPIPAIAVSDVLTKCIDGSDDPGLKARLEAIRSTIVTNEGVYDAHGKAVSLHLIPRCTAVGAVSKDELTALYSDHMSSTSGSARGIYDLIRNAAPHKRCPLCGAGTVAALDHHLPKSQYPDLAILPSNLVPACHYCNDAKRARYPRSAEEQTLHPYYDGHLQGQWLKAHVDRGPPVTVGYAVVTPPGWSKLDGERALRHFTVCKLAIKFASNAADELAPVRESLQQLWEAGGALATHAHLSEQTNKYAIRPNSWQHAFYQALRDDPWFVQGGFQKIAD